MRPYPRKPSADRYLGMSNEHKQGDEKTPHMEKQVMTEPMEEFVADQSVPSKSMQSGKSEESSPQRVFDTKDAGHEEKKMGHNFEEGVEG
jgi:hypothetical protein